MLTLDCQTRTLSIQLDHCAMPVERATLTRGDQHLVELQPTADPEDATRLILAVPDSTPTLMRGVWQLGLETDCRCYGAPVFVGTCAAPRVPSVHTPTSDTGPVQVCCAPALQPVWGTADVVLGFKAERSNGLTGYDSDLALGALLDPAPSHTELTFVTNDGPTFAGTLAPAQPDYPRWTLYDDRMVPVLTGTASGTTLTPDLPLQQLTCATYYVRFHHATPVPP